MANPTPVAGDVLAGKYRVERVLGAGGMGVVVEATHLQLRQRVALKFMTSELRNDESILKRFEREARAAARLEGEHVARVYDFGKLPGGAPYIVMEFLEGEDISALLDRDGPQEITRAVDLVLQACVGIAEAHAAGIVHRDIKPGNLFLSRRKDGRTIVKVVDFGISKLTNEGPGDARLTNGYDAIGSPMYMSPEQIESMRNVDHRADVWALGTVLYELVTGHPPFVADSPARVLSKVLTEEPPPMATTRSSVPPELDAVVAKALAKRLDDRFPTIADFAVALVPFGSKARAQTLSMATTRIIAMSRLSHDALPAFSPTVPPPPTIPDVPETTPAGAAVAPTLPSAADEQAPTVVINPEAPSPSVQSPGDVRRTSAAATWEESEEPRHRRTPVAKLGAVLVVVAFGVVLLVKWREHAAQAERSHPVLDSTPVASAAGPTDRGATLAEAIVVDLAGESIDAAAAEAAVPDAAPSAKIATAPRAKPTSTGHTHRAAPPKATAAVSAAPAPAPSASAPAYSIFHYRE